MDCWETLELEPNSDERSIKRQYARLLKKTRPDSAPEAFQALREAYEIALNWARWAADTHNDENTASDDVLQSVASEPQEITTNSLPEPIIQAPATSISETDLLSELLTDLRPSILTEHRLKAQDAGLAIDFERRVLRLCLSADPQTGLLEAACHEFGWLEERDAHSLSEAERLPVYERLIIYYLFDLRRLHNQGEPQALPDALKNLLRQPWLQSYDSRALLETLLVDMLLEMPAWSAETLDAIAAILGWCEGSNEPNCPLYQWQNLLERWDNERVYSKLSTDAQSRKTTPERRAARLIMAPFDRFQRRRFKRDFSQEELQLSADIASQLINRYPQLLDRLPGAPLDNIFWHDLTPEPPPLSRTQLLWILLFTATTFITFQLSERFVAGYLPVILMGSAIAAYALDNFLNFYERIWHRVSKLDYRLAEYLPTSWDQHGAGIRPLRHGVPAILSSAALAKAGGFYGHDIWLVSIPSAILILLLIHLVVRKNLIYRCSDAVLGLLHHHSAVIKKWLIGLAVVLAIAGIQFYLQNR